MEDTDVNSFLCYAKALEALRELSWEVTPDSLVGNLIRETDTAICTHWFEEMDELVKKTLPDAAASAPDAQTRAPYSASKVRVPSPALVAALDAAAPSAPSENTSAQPTPSDLSNSGPKGDEGVN